MTERTLWIIRAVAGGIVLPGHHPAYGRSSRDLHDQWVHKMNAQAGVPFENEAPAKKLPRHPA